ncbi:MAG TPA: hypothetical protein PK431_02130 [Chitinophagales bacterium]|nr:hypothetical protein [Chitinophagales bacterium]
MKKFIIISVLFILAICNIFAYNDSNKKSTNTQKIEVKIDDKNLSFDLNNISEQKIKEAARAFIKSYYKNNKEKREALLKMLEKENAKFNIDTDNEGTIIINETK